MQADKGRAADRLDFVIVGTQKGGTTALDHYLRQNTSVQMANTKKEMHFFDNERLNWQEPDYGPYHACFDWSSGACIRGEVTPVYMYWPNSIERIRAYHPNIKIVCLLRNPLLRAFSHWRMERARGRETLSFSEAIREGRQRLVTHPQSVRIHNYVERGFYVPQVQRLLANFDRGQILFLTSDHLREALLPALNQVAAFIGAKPFQSVTQKLVLPVKDEASHDLAPEDTVYLADMFADDIRQTMKLTELDLSTWLDPNHKERNIRSMA
jgi:hypothetical protein